MMKRLRDDIVGEKLHPVFLTKAEREQLLQDEHKQQLVLQNNSNDIYHRDHEREEKHKEREREWEEKHRLEAIKEQYLGSFNKPKKRVIKKLRFSFDWETTEDTSRDLNILCQNPSILFGRGLWGGTDRQEQKKLAKKKLEWKHWSEKKSEEMTERDWRIFKEDFNISYKGSKIPSPMRSWVESKLSSDILKSVARAGYKSPSPIQMASIPLGLQQRDVIGVAQTGSGKTAAFVLPMLNYITRLPRFTQQNEAQGPYAVVMAPSRELALQIEEETVKFARYLGIKVVSVVGGRSIQEQLFKIQQGCEIVIATPGRLIDCLERRYIVLNQCKYVVLDEADRMIDMGFEPQVVGVLDAMPDDEKRTTYMFSATMPPAVERLARKYLRNPVMVTVGGKATDKAITQHVIMVKETEKMQRLQNLLQDDKTKTSSMIMVFVNMKKTVDYVSKSLEKSGGYRVTTLHGGKSQEQREISLEDAYAE